MPFRSVEFGDSIINMKSVLTAQSPRWYQLKTAPFSWHFSCRCFFPFFPFFPFMANLFHGSGGPAAATHLCHAPAPGHGCLGRRGREAPCPALWLPAFCAPQLLLHLASQSSGIWVQCVSVSPCRDRAACAAPSTKPCGVPSPQLQSSGLPPQIIW